MLTVPFNQFAKCNCCILPTKSCPLSTNIRAGQFNMRYQLQQIVEVHKQRNALGNYFPAQIIHVHQLPIDGGNNIVYAEKQIAASLVLRCFTCGTLPKKKFSYNVRYEDGSEEQDVLPDRIRKPLRPPNL